MRLWGAGLLRGVGRVRAGAVARGALMAARRPGVILGVGAMLLLGVIVAAIVVEGWALIWLMMFSPVAMMLMNAGLQGGMGASGFFGFGEPSSPVKRVLVRAMLREGKCASCGYPLKGIPAQGDGCVVCSECGAAWRGARLGRSEELPAEVVVVR